ncbi:hypothetical protein [Planktotalea sp.]|uniref:hypothetical protein n=1 Tax=Planktotalea sp. TaxID=2029877 RepID=UPI0025F12AAF|nr:hypothetical protein [Planktotalea sp.]
MEDSAMQDAAMAARIRDILAELDGYVDVTVTVTSGIVTLCGTTLDGEKSRVSRNSPAALRALLRLRIA